MSFVREPNAEPIPGYRLIEPLGSGGFGEAWKCEAPGGIFKAIKFVFGNLNSLDVDGARAEQELKALNRVKEVRHPFVLQMDRIEVLHGELVIVMELADKSLHDSYEECLSTGLCGIPRDALLRYIRDAAEALDHMNEKHGLQHLDIKARNLFLVSDRVKVADFGLVKHLERSGASGIMGAVTPLYAPPETFTGEISGRSDQYSLAIVYQELLTGHRPFNGKTARQLAQQHMNESPDLRALPESERSIVARALEKDPANRFPSCLAFVRALYSARAPSFANFQLAPDAQANHPKSLPDSMEGFPFEGSPPVRGGGDPPFPPSFDDPLVPVELGISFSERFFDPQIQGEANQAVSNLGVTIAQPATGALRPTLIVGVGGYGRRALIELRCRLIDRFGDLDKVPMFRFLYVDTDCESVKLAQRGAAEVAFHTHEVYPLPLQPVIQYRRRQMDQLAEWLPREKLFSIPRNLKTQGCRALGRLAYSDHYQRLLARLKRELQASCDPDSIFQTVAQTGLALRDNTPRIYVLGSGTGGASGYLPDLGYAVRALARQAGSADAPVIHFLFCGAPEDPATPPGELANLYATLTELNHFCDPRIPFTAQYGVDGPRTSEDGSAFDQVYLITQPHRTPEARRDALSHVASYLFHELTTPLGIRLDQARARTNVPRAPNIRNQGAGPSKVGRASNFRSLGTFGVWFPRGLLLRVAAREACTQLLEQWQAGAGEPLTQAEQAMVNDALAPVQNDPELRPDALSARINQLASHHMDAPPKEALTRLLLGIEEQSHKSFAQDDPGGWARQTLTRVRDWLGSGVPLPGVSVVQQRKSHLTRALLEASEEAARQWMDRLSTLIDSLTDHGGRRIAVAEHTVSALIRFCDQSIQLYQTQFQEQSNQSREGQQQLETALENCILGAGGWSLFGGKSRRLLRSFLDHLAVFARQCLVEDTSAAVLHFYVSLRGKLNDHLRDLAFCRQRLRWVQELLSMPGGTEGLPEHGADTVSFTRTPGPNYFAGPGYPASGTSALPLTPLLSTDAYWQTIRDAITNRVVLPDNESDLETAARRFLSTLTPEHWVQLDQSIGESVLVPRNGLVKLCLNTGDLGRHFAGPLLNETISRLSDHLPITDVAQVLCSEGESLADRILNYHELAVPTLTRKESSWVQPVTSEAHLGSGVRQAELVGEPGGAMASRSSDPHISGGPGKPSGPVGQSSYLLIPASEAGKALIELAKEVLPEAQLVNVPGQADLMFCREQAALRIEDLESMLHACRNAYYELSLIPQSSPHARFDISDWTPLDP